MRAITMSILILDFDTGTTNGRNGLNDGSTSGRGDTCAVGLEADTLSTLELVGHEHVSDVRTPIIENGVRAKEEQGSWILPVGCSP